MKTSTIVPTHSTLPTPQRHYFVSWLHAFCFWQEMLWYTSQRDTLLQPLVCHHDKIFSFVFRFFSSFIHSFIHLYLHIWMKKIFIKCLFCSQNYAFHCYHSYSTCERKPQKWKALKILFSFWHSTSLGNWINTHISNSQLHYF